MCVSISVYKPGITESECATKFRNLRNQFNIVNGKVKASMKSGTGTDNVIMKINSLMFFNILYNNFI